MSLISYGSLRKLLEDKVHTIMQDEETFFLNEFSQVHSYVPSLILSFSCFSSPA